MRAAKTSRRRFIFYPVLILVAVAVVMYFSDRSEPQRIASIQASVTQWCEAAARGEDIRARLPVSDSLLTNRLHDAIVDACAPLREGAGPGSGPSAGRRLEIAVAPGFGPDPGITLQGRDASHHALIRIDGSLRLGLRFLHANDAPVIVGYWIPDPADAHADGPTSAIRSREQ